jgi:hypothetical protein
MIKVFRNFALITGSLGLLTIGLGGCAESNEQRAEITGVAPENAPQSQAEYDSAKPGGGTDPDYPGASR